MWPFDSTILPLGIHPQENQKQGQRFLFKGNHHIIYNSKKRKRKRKKRQTKCLTISDWVIKGWGLHWAENWVVPKIIFLKDTNVLNLKHL